MRKLIRILLWLLIIVVAVLGISYLLSGGTTTIHNEVRIERPQEEVFDFVADMRNELKWNPDVQVMEKVSDGPISLGTRFKAKWHLSDTLEVRVTRYARPGQVTFENGGPLEVKLDLDLSTEGSTTVMRTAFHVTPHGFLRAMFPIMKEKLESQEALNMTNLKKALEAH